MSGTSATDVVVFALVVGARLVVPLFIGRFPLPAIIACLVIDGVDKSIFQATTNLDLTDYQSYDKALDIYYLAIAYLATLRNWPDRFATGVAAALWYYRLVGVLAFELTGARWLLLAFPNTFEYFFIAVEIVRTRWDQRRLSRSTLLWLAAGIWVVIKLPQEWWIHVAQLDFTDEFAQRVLGVEPDDGWVAGFQNRPWVLVALVALLAALVLLARWGWPRLPAPDRPFTLDAGAVPGGAAGSTAGGAANPTSWPGRRAGVVTPWAVAEKALLAGLVTTILASSYPRVDTRWWAVWLVVGATVVVHALLDLWRARRGGQRGRARLAPSGRASAARQLAGNTVVSLLIMGALAALVSGGRASDVAIGDALLFAYVVAFITTLYDRWAGAAWVRATPRDSSPGTRSGIAAA